MPRDKLVLTVIGGLIAVSVLLSLAGVHAGDPDGGGTHDIIMSLL